MALVSSFCITRVYYIINKILDIRVLEILFTIFASESCLYHKANTKNYY